MTQPTRLEVRANMQLTNEQITELAEPFWLKDAQKEGEFFDTNGFASALLAAAPAQSAKPVENKTAKAHDLLATLIDVYDDGQNNAPEDRCYVEGTWAEVLSEARDYLAASSSAPHADSYCSVNCKTMCQNSTHGVCDGPPTAPQPSPTAVVLDERAAFEAWYGKNYASKLRDYSAHTKCERAWNAGWQARAASPQPVAPSVEQTRALTDDARDAERWRYCVEICHQLSDSRGEFVCVELPRLEGDFRSTDEMFIATIDAALTAARPASGETE